MEATVRAFLRDPIVGLPLLALAVVVLAHAIVWLRSVADGVTPIVPSLRVFAADVAIVLMAALLLAFSKALDLFVPEEGTEIAGIDVGPIYSTVGPAVFVVAGLALLGWLFKRKAEAIITSAKPPEDPV